MAHAFLKNEVININAIEIMMVKQIKPIGAREKGQILGYDLRQEKRKSRFTQAGQPSYPLEHLHFVALPNLSSKYSFNTYLFS